MKKPQSSEALEAFRRYTQAFEALDARAVSECFHEPALMISPKGVDALLDTAAVEKRYAAIMAELPAMGYDRTDFSELRERSLGDDLVAITGSGTWRKASGETFMPFGSTYTLRRTGGQWRIAVAIIHSADAAP
ncbi:MAG TPA: nuclear transport factor 2 family protein [Polyangiaceae bacterium]|nr:nuclear transport factor 2 family protein [Polyangiaceae bacterium]